MFGLNATAPTGRDAGHGAVLGPLGGGGGADPGAGAPIRACSVPARLLPHLDGL